MLKQATGDLRWRPERERTRVVLLRDVHLLVLLGGAVVGGRPVRGVRPDQLLYEVYAPQLQLVPRAHLPARMHGRS